MSVGRRKSFLNDQKAGRTVLSAAESRCRRLDAKATKTGILFADELVCYTNPTKHDQNNRMWSKGMKL